MAENICKSQRQGISMANQYKKLQKKLYEKNKPDDKKKEPKVGKDYPILILIGLTIFVCFLGWGNFDNMNRAMYGLPDPDVRAPPRQTLRDESHLRRTRQRREHRPRDCAVLHRPLLPVLRLNPKRKSSDNVRALFLSRSCRLTQRTAVTSTSQSAPAGRSLTATQLLAGLEMKCLA